MSELQRIPLGTVRSPSYAAEPGNPCVICGRSVGVSAGHLFLNGSDIVPIGTKNAMRASIHINPCVEPDHPQLRPYIEEMNEPVKEPKAKKEKRPLATSGKITAYVLEGTTGEVLGYRTSADAIAYANQDTSRFVVTAQEQLKKVPSAVLVKVYNFVAASAPDGEPKARPITRFSDAETAARRCWPAIQYLGETRRGPVPDTTPTSEDADMATTKKRGGKKSAAKKGATTKKARGETRGRPSKYAGKKIYKLTEGNPCNKGSLREKVWNSFKSGDPVEKVMNHPDFGYIMFAQWFKNKNIKIA